MAGNVDVCQQQVSHDDGDFDLSKALDEMEATLCGTWKLLKNENLDEYLKMIGIGFVYRKIADKAPGSMIFTREGNALRMVTKGPKNSEHLVVLNKEEDSSDPADNKMMAVVTWKDGTLTTNSRPAEGSKAKPTVVQRKVEIQDGKTILIMTVTCNGLVMRRIFAKQKD